MLDIRIPTIVFDATSYSPSMVSSMCRPITCVLPIQAHTEVIGTALWPDGYAGGVYCVDDQMLHMFATYVCKVGSR